MNGNGSIYRRKDRYWCAKYRDASGKWKYLYRKTKAEAKQVLREALNEVDEGICPTNQTVNDALDTWLDGMQDTVSRRTWLNRESLVRVHIKGHRIGTKKLTKLTPEDVRLFYREKLNSGLAPSTVKRLHDILNKATKQAVTSRVIRHNPISEVKPPKQVEQYMDVLTPQQVCHLLDAVRGDRLELVYVFGATCGLRVGEALALRYEDFDMERGTFSIRRTVWRSKVYPPKTRESRRTLKLPNIALEALERRGIEAKGYLFATKHGNPVDPANFHSHNWKPALRKAGLSDSIHFHDLRHGAASLLLGQNVPIPVVSRYLGHSNPSTTMRVYAHMIDGMGGMAANGMDDALS